MQSSVSAGPPQIISAHFQPREFAISRWLRQEIRNVWLFLPFVRTTAGRVSKPSLEDAIDAFAVGFGPTPLAQADGFVIPAFISAAAIFSCCVISATIVEPEFAE